MRLLVKVRNSFELPSRDPDWVDPKLWRESVDVFVDVFVRNGSIFSVATARKKSFEGMILKIEFVLRALRRNRHLLIPPANASEEISESHAFPMFPTRVLGNVSKLRSFGGDFWLGNIILTARKHGLKMPDILNEQTDTSS